MPHPQSPRKDSTCLLRETTSKSKQANSHSLTKTAPNPLLPLPGDPLAIAFHPPQKWRCPSWGCSGGCRDQLLSGSSPPPGSIPPKPNWEHPTQTGFRLEEARPMESGLPWPGLGAEPPSPLNCRLYDFSPQGSQQELIKARPKRVCFNRN